MKKISIIGATVLGNRGAEAMLGTTIGRIKEKHPDAEFYVYSYYPEDDKKLITDVRITVHSATPLYLVTVLFPFSIVLWFFNLFQLKAVKNILPTSVKDLADSDVLIDLAGVSFMDGRTIFLPFNIMTIWPAMLVGTPVVKFAQGLGSFKQTATKISAKLFLPRCKQLFARGEITQMFLEEFFPTNINYQPAGDVAFSHKQGDSISSENINYSNEIQIKLASIQDNQNSIIGLCPSSVVLSKSQKSGIDYIGTLVQMIENILKEEDTYIFLFPNKVWIN
jgi:polysaccharide pyruvyl transferase WcaK-like protein